MTRKVFNMNGGRHSQAALSAFINALYGTSVANGLNVTAYDGTGLKVVVKPGTGNIDTELGYGHMVQADADETITLAAASPSLPRNSLIVGYIDKAVAPTTTVVDNINGIFKIKEIAGTPAASPQDPPASVIQSGVGAINPYIVLGRVRVGANATSLAQSMITDMRKLVGLPFSGNHIADASIRGSKLARGTVKADNIDFTTMQFGSLVQVENKGVTLPRNVDTVVLTYSLDKRAMAMISASDATNKINILINGAIVGYISGSGTVTIPINKGSVVSIQNTVASSISLWLRSSYITM